MIDLSTETKLTVSEACRHPLLKRNGKPLNRSVMQRWISQPGIRKPGGEYVILETERVGGLRITSVEAIKRFVADLNGRTQAKPQTKWKSAHSDAMRELAAAGI